MNNKKWSEILNDWENGNYPKMPQNIKKPFLWRTSVINKNNDLICKQEFTEDERLYDRIKQDYTPFLKPPSSLLSKKNEKEKHAIASINLPKDTVLVIPKPRAGKNFSNIFHFMKNASSLQQKKIWQLVAKEAKKMLKKFDNIWISSQGLGVNYLHIRICSYPKYYEKSKLQNLPYFLKNK